MAKQGKNKKGAPKSVSNGSQGNHQAVPTRERHPERKLLRILQSSGLEQARAYAEHFDIQGELDKSYFVEAKYRLYRRQSQSK